MSRLDITCQVPFCGRGSRYQLRDLNFNDCRYVCARHLDQAERLFAPVAAAKRPVCIRCGEAMPVPEREQGGGRTKLYCSTRCRVAAHRARPAPWSSDTLHGSLGTEKA